MLVLTSNVFCDLILSKNWYTVFIAIVIHTLHVRRRLLSLVYLFLTTCDLVVPALGRINVMSLVVVLANCFV